MMPGMAGSGRTDRESSSTVFLVVTSPNWWYDSSGREREVKLAVEEASGSSGSASRRLAECLRNHGLEQQTNRKLLADSYNLT